MTALLTSGVQAFIACDATGRAEPVVVSIFGDTAGEVHRPGFSPKTIMVLEQLLDATGYRDMTSFSIHEDNLDFMEARVQFVMDELFASDNRILMVRCDTHAAAQAFVDEVERQYTVKSLREARRGLRAPPATQQEHSHAHTGGNAS
jgi:hypothetical protein